VPDEIMDRIVNLVAERMGVEPDQLTVDTHFVNDLQSDSLDMAELVIDLEEEFDLTISDEEAQKIETIGQAAEFIRQNQEE